MSFLIKWEKNLNIKYPNKMFHTIKNLQKGINIKTQGNAL